LLLPSDATLLVIDVQNAIDAPYWAKDGPRNNPVAEGTIARLQAAWRRTGRPIVHVRHDSREPGSAYRPGQPGNDIKSAVNPLPGETVLPKNVCNAFVGTDLEARLRAKGRSTLVICGVITNNSVEATARMAGDLGFKTYVVADACFTFGKRDWFGNLRSADEVHAMSLANLAGEYATIATADAIIAVLG
jgi:nicotinamidase-related amidase